MRNNKNEGKEYDYIEEITEWQENQYNPGHYTGGKIPPYLNKSGKPKLLGWMYIIQGIFAVFIFIMILAREYKTMPLYIILVLVILLLGTATLGFAAGIRMLRKGNNNKK